MFTCDRRVIRGGVLVAFKGQRMPEEEARALGLIEPPEPKAPKRSRKKKEE